MITIQNVTKGPSSQTGQKFYRKLIEYSRLINTNLNRVNLMALANETGDQEFINLTEEVDLKQIVRTANKIMVQY